MVLALKIDDCESACQGDSPLSKPLLCFAVNEIESHPCVKHLAPIALARINTARLAFDVCTFSALTATISTR